MPKTRSRQPSRSWELPQGVSAEPRLRRVRASKLPPTTTSKATTPAISFAALSISKTVHAKSTNSLGVVVPSRAAFNSWINSKSHQRSPSRQVTSSKPPDSYSLGCPPEATNLARAVSPSRNRNGTIGAQAGPRSSRTTRARTLANEGTHSKSKPPKRSHRRNTDVPKHPQSARKYVPPCRVGSSVDSSRMHTARHSLTYALWLKRKARRQAEISRDQRKLNAEKESDAKQRRARARKEFCKWKRKLDASRRSLEKAHQDEVVAGVINHLMKRVSAHISFKQWEGNYEKRQLQEKKKAAQRTLLVQREIAALEIEQEQRQKWEQQFENCDEAKSAKPRRKSRKLRRKTRKRASLSPCKELHLPVHVSTSVQHKNKPVTRRRNRKSNRKLRSHSARRPSLPPRVERRFTRPQWNDDLFYPEGAYRQRAPKAGHTVKGGFSDGEYICRQLSITAKVGSTHQLMEDQLDIIARRKAVKNRTRGAIRRRTFANGRVSKLKGAQKWLEQRKKTQLRASKTN